MEVLCRYRIWFNVLNISIMKKSLAFALVLAAMVACDKAAPAPEGAIES